MKLLAARWADVRGSSGAYEMRYELDLAGMRPRSVLLLPALIGDPSQRLQA
jgi:hypothetical protein